MLKIFNKKEEDPLAQINKEAKRREFTANIKNTVNDVANWCYNNRESLMLITPMVMTVIGGGSKIISSTIRKSAVDKEQKLKDLRIYDHSRGAYCELKRKMTRKELLEYDARRDNGESVIKILESMKLLKN